MRLSELQKTDPLIEIPEEKMDMPMVRLSEIEHPIVRKVYDKPFHEHVKKFFSESAKGLARGFPQTMGMLQYPVQIAYDQVKSIAQRQLAEDGNVFGREGSIEERDEKTKRRIALNTAIVEDMDRVLLASQRLQNQFLEFSDKGWLQRDPEIFRGSFMENPSWTRAVALGLESAPLLGMGMAVTYATGSPLLGGSVVGIVDASDKYLQYRDAGYSRTYAMQNFVLDTLVLSVLESLPMSGFLKGGPLPMRMLRGGWQEGFEEVLQGIWKEGINAVGDVDMRKLTENLVESFVAGAVSGMFLGTFGRSVEVKKGEVYMPGKYVDDLINKARAKGVDVDGMMDGIRVMVTNSANEATDLFIRRADIGIGETQISQRTGKMVRNTKTGEVFLLQDDTDVDIEYEELPLTEEFYPIKEEDLNRVEDLAKKIGIDVKIEYVHEARYLDPKLDKAELLNRGLSEKEINDAIENKRKFVEHGYHTMVTEPSGKRWSYIRLGMGATKATLFHELVHSIDESGGLPGWSGTAEQRADYIADLFVRGQEGSIIELTEDGSRVKAVQDAKRLEGTQFKVINVKTYDTKGKPAYVNVKEGDEIVTFNRKMSESMKERLRNQPYRKGKTPKKIFDFREKGEKYEFEGRDITINNIWAELLTRKMRQGQAEFIQDEKGDIYIVAKGKGSSYIPAYKVPDPLSKTNEKVKAWILDMPAIWACRNCKTCSPTCYAISSQWLRPAVKLKRFANLYRFLNHRDDMMSAIKKQLEKDDLGMFRFHSSGDVFSQYYLDFMDTLVKSYPNIRFYTYTKVADDPTLNWSKILKNENFNLVNSVLPGGEKNYGTPKFVKSMLAKYKGRKYRTCPATDPSEANLPASEKTHCGILWKNKDGKGKVCSLCTKNAFVLFYQHGTSNKEGAKAITRAMEQINYSESINQYKMGAVNSYEGQGDFSEETVKANVEKEGFTFKGIMSGDNSIYSNKPTLYFDDNTGSTKVVPLDENYIQAIRDKKTKFKLEPVPSEQSQEAYIKNFEGMIDKELLKKVKQYKSWVKSGRRLTIDQIRQNQKDFKDLILNSGLEEKDINKFITALTNINDSQTALQDTIEEFMNRAYRLKMASAKRAVKSEITKQLKSSKPVKRGSVKKGRYDFLTNKIFSDLRAYNKMTKSEAMDALNAMDPPTNNLDLARVRFLDYKSKGMDGTHELFMSVLDTIVNLKRAGLEAKSEADFEKAYNEAKRIDEVLDAVKNRKGSPASILTKFENLYRRGIADIGSLLESIAGKTGRSFDPDIYSNRANTAVSFQNNAMIKAVKEIYGLSNSYDVYEHLANMAMESYKIRAKDGVVNDISKFHIIDIYLGIRNDNTRKLFYENYDRGQIDMLIGNLSEEDILLAQAMQAIVQEYREVFNQHSIKTTGLEINFVDYYWPRTSERRMNILDERKSQGEQPRQEKQRAKGGVIPVAENAWLKMMKHIGEGEHVRHLSDQYSQLMSVFGDRRVKSEIVNKYGKKVYEVLLQHINYTSLNYKAEYQDILSGFWNQVVNNWIVAKIGIPNTNVFIKQLVSTTNYTENMPVQTWTKYFLEGISNPKETFQYMWNRNPFLEARFQRGSSEAMRQAIHDADQFRGAWNSYIKFMTVLARSGDISAIIYGGYPYYRYVLEQTGSRQQAMDKFEEATIKAQQSGNTTSRSNLQNKRDPFSRTLLAFKNTPIQYLRKIVNANIALRNGEISADKYVKTMLVYGVIQPSLFVGLPALKIALIKGVLSAMTGKKGDEEEDPIFTEMLIQILMTLPNSIPIVDDIAMALLRNAFGLKKYKPISVPVIDDLVLAIQKMTKEEMSFEDYMYIIGTATELSTAFSPKGIVNELKRLIPE